MHFYSILVVSCCYTEHATDLAMVSVTPDSNEVDLIPGDTITVDVQASITVGETNIGRL